MSKPHEPPRARLQALLKIPERERTDAQWDEIHELEIEFAPGNIQRSAQYRVPTHGNAAPTAPTRDTARQAGKKRFKQGRKQRRSGATAVPGSRHGK